MTMIYNDYAAERQGSFAQMHASKPPIGIFETQPATSTHWYGTNPKVLIVEDEPALVSLYRDCFHAYDFECLSTADIGAARAMAATEDIAVVLLDLMLPTGDVLPDGQAELMSDMGIVLLSQLKAARDARVRAIPVVVCTNLYRGREFERSQEMGAAAHISKVDTTPQDVARVLRQVLGYDEWLRA